MLIVDAPASRLCGWASDLPTMTAVMAAEAKAEPNARSIEADAWPVVARTVGVARIVVVVAVVVGIAPEAAIVRTEAMMPEARPAMHLVGRVDISDGAL